MKRKWFIGSLAAMLGFFLACFCAGCKKGVQVPSDCQVFLGKYFEAVKSKDVAQLQELSSYISRAEREQMDERGTALWLESKRKIAVEAFERARQEFGDFESYSVLSVKETTLTSEDLAAKKMQGLPLEGIHTEVLCKAKFSKHPSTLVNLTLFKETPESEYSLEAWHYEAQP